MKLDTKTVTRLTLPSGKTDVIHFDETLSGFGYRLRAGSDGKVLRSWVVQYRRGGATRRMLLGSAEVLGAEQARAAAKKVLAKVALGADPQAERSERRGKDKLSLRAVIADYLAMKQREVRPHTFRDLNRYLTGTAFKPLHGMPIDKVSRKDVASRLVAVVHEHGDIVAVRARIALSTFFVWAMQMGLVEHNPVIGTFKPKDSKPRERVLSDAELAAIWNACQENDDHGRIVRLMILLGARRAEVGGMRWSELDLESAHTRWRLPPERSKNGKAHELPLMPLAFDVINSVPRRVGRDHLFGARSPNGFSAWDTCKQSLDARSDITAWTPHDIRRTLSTRLHDLGVAPHVVEQILNHQSHRGTVGGVYNKSLYEREVRSALALWEDWVRALVAGGERKIVPMRQVPG
jgi:integrase